MDQNDRELVEKIENTETIAMLCLRIARRTRRICNPECNLFNHLGYSLMRYRNHLMGDSMTWEDGHDCIDEVNFLMVRTGIIDMEIRDLARMAGEIE